MLLSFDLGQPSLGSASSAVDGRINIRVHSGVGDGWAHPVQPLGVAAVEMCSEV